MTNILTLHSNEESHMKNMKGKTNVLKPLYFDKMIEKTI